MDVYFELIEDAGRLEKACSEFITESFLGFDTETTELDPLDGELRLIQISNGRKTVVVDVRKFSETADIRESEDLQPLRDLLYAGTPVKVAHNAKFDAKWVRHHLGAELRGVFDTMLGSQLISAGERDRRHSLKEVSSFFLGLEIDKAEQRSDWGAEQLSQSQIEYAARDAATMVPLREKIAGALKDDSLERAAQIEFDCVMAIAQMELNGIFLDTEKWKTQLEAVAEKQKEVGEELQHMLSAGVAQVSLFGAADINLDSHAQVTDALRNLGVPVPETTRGWQLQPLAPEYPVVEKLLEYRSVAKSLTSFGENILEFVDPATGRIHADFRQIGTPSGRFSCSRPNLQQIPHEMEYRRCFRAEPGNKLVIADYSQIELRILAEFSGDRRFIEAFRGGEDFHALTASQVFGVGTSEVSAEQRTFAKRLNFGVVYGIGSQRFAMISGVTREEAEHMMRKYFATYPELDAWLRRAGGKAVSERNARTASGRMARFNFDEDDSGAVASTQRYGKNFPIQGTSADILKKALFLLHESIRGTSAKLVNIVHDEIVLEAAESEAAEIAARTEQSMIAAAEDYISKVPVVVDVSVGEDWSK